MIRKPIGYWTKENCLLEASKYLTRGEFKLGCGSAYKVARKNGWLDLVTWNKQPKKGYFCNYYTCKEEAKKYNTRYALKKVLMVRIKSLYEINGLTNGLVRKKIIILPLSKLYKNKGTISDS